MNSFSMSGLSRHAAIMLSVVVACIVSAGCGSRKYEERLGATVTFFDHMHLLNKQLKEPFRDQESNIQIRPPRGFAVVPAPKPMENEEGELVWPELDDRQPVFLDADLPGMIAAWKLKVTADLKNESASAEAHMLIFSNLGPLPEGGIPAYSVETLGMIGRELGVDLTEGSLHDESFPKNSSEGFVPQVFYKARTITSERLIDGLTTEFSIYLYRNGDDQVFVMFVMPKNVSGRGSLLDQIELSLQTLKVGGSSKSTGDESQPSGKKKKSSKGGGF